MMLFHKAGAALFMVVAIGIVGCVSQPSSETGELDARLAWPCDRLVLTWSVNADSLKTAVGVNLTARSQNGIGELRLSILRCEPPLARRSNATPLLYALVTIPVTVESVPLVITSMPSDGWFSVLQIIADPNTDTLFSDLGYEVSGADMTFMASRIDSETAIEARLTFDDGQIAVFAQIAGEPVPHDASLALLDRGESYLSAFFGEESAERYSSVSATIHIEGETPLSMFDLPRTSTTALLYRTLRSDRIYWRLPMVE